jgi:hypothetical protein
LTCAFGTGRGQLAGMADPMTIPPAPVRRAGRVRAWPAAEPNAIVAAARGECILVIPRRPVSKANFSARVGSPHRPAAAGRWKAEAK